MAVSKEVREKINWFIYAYETLDKKEIESNLLDVSSVDISEVLSIDFFMQVGNK